MPEVARTDQIGNKYFHPAAGEERLAIEAATSRLVRRKRPLFTTSDFNSFTANIAYLIGHRKEPTGFISSSHEPHDQTAKPENFGLTDPARKAHFRFYSYCGEGWIRIAFPTSDETISYKPKSGPIVETAVWVPASTVVRYRSYALGPLQLLLPPRYVEAPAGLTPEGLQAVCRKIYTVYENQEKAK